MIVIYHRADYDGLFSGAVCKKFMPDAKLIGWDFGDPIPNVPPDEDLYIVDLSIPELMAHPKLTWIDHHKSAIERFFSDIPGYRIDGVAACRLCWQFFTSDQPLPTLDDFRSRRVKEPFALTLAGEYDVWDLRDELATYFQYGLVAEGWNTVDLLTGLLSTERYLLDDCVASGEDAYSWQQNFAANVLKDRSYTRQWEGLQFCILGSPHARSSMWFPKWVLPEGTQALMCWRYDGEKVAFSLYHAPGHEEHDLSQIAVKYGGGGHKGACGFTISLDEALPIIK